MDISFDDYITEILFKECIQHCYYEDPEHPEISKEINKVIDKLKKELNGR